MTVDLPEPVEPTRKTHSPRPTENVAWSRPTAPTSYFFSTARNSITDAAAGVALCGTEACAAAAGVCAAAPRRGVRDLPIVSAIGVADSSVRRGKSTRHRPLLQAVLQAFRRNGVRRAGDRRRAALSSAHDRDL